jgi:hypothetical protein
VAINASDQDHGEGGENRGHASPASMRGQPRDQVPRPTCEAQPATKHADQHRELRQHAGPTMTPRTFTDVHAIDTTAITNVTCATTARQNMNSNTRSLFIGYTPSSVH